MRRSSSRTPSERSNSQSPPPGRILPRSRSPSKSPPATGTKLRTPWGTAPNFCRGAAMIFTVMSGREFMLSSPTCSWLQDFVDRVNRPGRAAIAGGDSDQTVQERIGWCARFKPGRGPEVVLRRIDGLPSHERRQYVRGPMTKAEGAHTDQGAVVGLERDAQIELENGVGPRECPVTSARQDLAAQARAFEGTARDGRYEARSMRHSAELLQRRDENLKHHQQTRSHTMLNT